MVTLTSNNCKLGDCGLGLRSMGRWGGGLVGSEW